MKNAGSHEGNPPKKPISYSRHTGIFMPGTIKTLKENRAPVWAVCVILVRWFSVI
jgi:hypothetical protein